VRGTAGALNALVKAIVAKTYLLHYGCDFLSFTEQLVKYEDQDAAWALPVEDITDENDESYSLYDDEEEIPDIPDSPIASIIEHSTMNHRPPSIVVSRERKLSLPLSSIASGIRDATSAATSFSPDDHEFKKLLKELVKNSQEIASIDSVLIAEEITRIEAIYFLDIEVCRQ
jgi:hypothetical protein